MQINDLKVVDATSDATFCITPTDIQIARKKAGGKPQDPESCAAAIAGKRDFGASRVRVHSGRVYVLRKNHWVRYITSQALKNEIIAIDRGGRMEPGEYDLIAPHVSQRLGYAKPTGPKQKRGKQRRGTHMTANIRTRVPYKK